eukprot:SAG11_NODE_438_length_9463_cov_47.214957_9_plen_67_part_00
MVLDDGWDYLKWSRDMVGLTAYLKAGPNGGDYMPKMHNSTFSLARAHTAIALSLLLRLSTHEHTYI